MYQEPMYLHTATEKTADAFIARLREVERMNIRMANEGTLEHLRQTTFAYDMLTPEVMAEVKQKLHAQFAELSSGPWWAKRAQNT